MRALLPWLALVLSAGTVAGLALWGPEPAAGGAGSHPVRVVGPDGGILFEGEPTATPATALSLLEATGLPIEVVRYAGAGAYVRAIGGHEARGAAGWTYATATDADEWTPGDRSAAERTLAPGERLLWRWSVAT